MTLNSLTCDAANRQLSGVELFLFWWLFLYALHRRKHACGCPSLFIRIVISRSVGGWCRLFIWIASCCVIMCSHFLHGILLVESGNICPLWRVHSIFTCLDDCLCWELLKDVLKLTIIISVSTFMIECRHCTPINCLQDLWLAVTIAVLQRRLPLSNN
jgi:hypothetical protein